MFFTFTSISVLFLTPFRKNNESNFDSIQYKNISSLSCKKNHFILTELTQQLIIKGKSVKIGLSAGRRIVVHLWFQVLFLCVK